MNFKQLTAAQKLPIWKGMRVKHGERFGTIKGSFAGQFRVLFDGEDQVTYCNKLKLDYMPDENSVLQINPTLTGVSDLRDRFQYHMTPRQVAAIDVQDSKAVMVVDGQVVGEIKSVEGVPPPWQTAVAAQAVSRATGISEEVAQRQIDAVLQVFATTDKRTTDE